MRISFVTNYGPGHTGVHTHTNARLEQWRADGHDVAFFSLPLSVPGRPTHLGLPRYLLSASEVVSRVEQEAADLTVVRWLFPDPMFFRKLSRIAPVVIEVHGDPLSEARRGLMRRTLDRLLRAPALSVVSGAYFMNQTAFEDPLFSRVQGPRVVLGNGARIRHRSIPDPARPQVVGMSLAQANPWHGVDRLVELCLSTPDLRYEVVCPAAHATALSRQFNGIANLAIVPTEGLRDYEETITRWTAALGSMALERSGHLAGSTLKVRDYISLGVPTILPHWDAELSLPAMQIDGAGPNTSTGIWCVKREASLEPVVVPVEGLRMFLRSVHEVNVKLELCTAVSVERLEGERLKFLQEVVRRAS